MKKIEDYKVIDKKNRITDHKAHIAKDSPFPVMYVDKFPVWEGDKVLFVNNVGTIQIKTISLQDRTFVSQNPDWANLFFFDIRKIDYSKTLTIVELKVKDY